MKSTLKSFFKKLFGLAPMSHADTGEVNAGVRLARLPFFLIHLLTYAVLYFLVQAFIMMQANRGVPVSIGEFGFAVIIFLITLVLSPIYVRRAHDIGWSLKYVITWAILPSFLRILLLMIPLFALFNPNLIQGLLRIMPYIGVAYWSLGQIQILFAVILVFAPGTGTHNKYGPHVSRSITLQNLYGFTLFKKNADSLEKKIAEMKETEIKDEKKNDHAFAHHPKHHNHGPNHNHSK